MRTNDDNAAALGFFGIVFTEHRKPFFFKSFERETIVDERTERIYFFPGIVRKRPLRRIKGMAHTETAAENIGADNSHKNSIA